MPSACSGLDCTPVMCQPITDGSVVHVVMISCLVHAAGAAGWEAFCQGQRHRHNHHQATWHWLPACGAKAAVHPSRPAHRTPHKPGPRCLPDGIPCGLCALKAFTLLLDESRTESCQRHTLHHRQILREFDIRPDVSRLPLDSCHKYTSLDGWATRLRAAA